MTTRKAILKEIAEASAKTGFEYEEKANGHFVIKGPLTVNYYPFSKKKTAYVKSTVKGFNQVSPKQAFEMAKDEPKAGKKTDKRRGNYRNERQRLHNKGVNNCHWCGCELTIDTSTLEHIIPLGAGGLDNRNNYTLACEPCNSGRGSGMPELSRGDNE